MSWTSAAQASLEALRETADAQLTLTEVEAQAVLAGKSAAATSPVAGAPVAGQASESSDPAAVKPEPREPFFQKPLIVEFPRSQALGRLLGAFKLAERLDTHRALFTKKLGAKNWDFSMASDPKFDVQYITLRHAETIVLHRIESLSDLRGSGVEVRVDDSTVYNFKVSINIFSPVRGSTLKINPVRGTRGASHKIKTGKVLDAVERESFVFKAGGKELWLLYGTDVDPETDAYADTRSLLFIHENGMSSKAWPVPEDSLEAGKPVLVDLGGTKIALVKTLGGDLRIHEAGGGAAGAPAAR
ncbi:MAG: hypothetical protein V3S11_02885 [Elusimicrobiota bacterium]